MKIRKLLSVLLIASLTAPVYGQNFPLGSDLIDPSITAYSTAPFFMHTGGQSQGCKASRSQSRLLNFFDNKTCQDAGRDILGEDISKPMCESVYTCTERNEMPLSADEQSFLKSEFMMYVISENVQDELTKYQSPEANDLRVLNSYIDKMPAKYKEKVKSCPAFKLSSPKCLNEDEFDLLAKISIKNFYGTNQAQNFFNFRKRSASIQATEDNGIGRSGLAKDIDKKRHGARYQLPPSVLPMDGEVDDAINLMQNVKFGKDVTPEEHYTSILKTEKEWSKQGRSELNFDPAEDVLVNEIVKSVMLGQGMPSEAEMKLRIKKTILQFANSKEDPYLSFDKETIESLEKNIDKLTISLKDIADSNRANLAAKINELRVKTVNDVFARECQDKVVSLGQLCQSVSTNVKSAKVKGEIVQTKDLFKKMSDSYMKTGFKASFDKVNQLNRMIKAKDQVYDRFVTVMFNLNSCKEKFPSTYVATKEDKKAFENLAKAEDEKASANLNEAARNIAEVVNKDDGLKNVFKNRGVDIEAFKFDSKQSSANVDFNAGLLAKEGTKIAPAQEKEKELKPFVAENQLPASNQNVVNPIQNPSYNFMNNMLPAVDNSAAIQVNRPATDAIEEKIKSLEKKESKLRKKVAINDEVDESESEEGSELASLRRQIEDLKKEKDRVATGPSAVQETADKNNTQTARSPASADQTASIKVAAEKTPVENGTRGEEVAPVRSTAASSNADYGAEAQAAIGNARGPGSTAAATNAAGKGGAEKGSNALVLSKGGESAIDVSTILENPNEGDISSVMEKTKGEPFIIRENGELIKVTPVLDAKGKPVLSSSGKIKFKKIKLTKAQQEIIVKETNVNKAAKEVGVEPTRLYKLKSLLKEVRRE